MKVSICVQIIWHGNDFNTVNESPGFWGGGEGYIESFVVPDVDGKFFKKGGCSGLHISSNRKRSAEVAQKLVCPCCDGEEELGFIMAGVGSWVEVEADKLGSGQNRKAVCEGGVGDTSGHVWNLLDRGVLARGQG